MPNRCRESEGRHSAGTSALPCVSCVQHSFRHACAPQAVDLEAAIPCAVQVNATLPSHAAFFVSAPSSFLQLHALFSFSTDRATLLLVQRLKLAARLALRCVRVTAQRQQHPRVRLTTSSRNLQSATASSRTLPLSLFLVVIGQEKEKEIRSLSPRPPLAALPFAQVQCTAVSQQIRFPKHFTL